MQPDAPLWSACYAGGRVTKKRDRKPLSCESCRSKKLRCDRALPACSNCLSRPEITSCFYSSSGDHKARTAMPKSSSVRPRVRDSSTSAALPSSSAESEDLHAKMERLEQIIRSLTSTKAGDREAGKQMAGVESSKAGEDCDQNADQTTDLTHYVAAPVPILTPASVSSSSVAGEALWSTLLGELADLHAKVRGHASPAPQRSLSTLLFVATHSVSQADILLHLPSRHTCNKMVAAFFSNLEPTLCFLHKPTFWEQYEAFWLQPTRTPIVWVAMLFGMLRVAVVAWMRDSREPVEIQGKCSDLATSYRHRCIECLTHANYGRPEEFLLEALLFHLYAEFSASRDFHPDVWVLHGMVVRTSMRLGYHLDPCSLRDITPFQAEMRRRVWTFVRVSDILLSFQISLPSMVSPRWLAGALPRNLHDDDFHRQSDELPAARPDGETTRVSFLIHKAKLIFGFAKALDEIELSHCMTYTRVLKLDNELRSIYRSMPLQFQLHDLPDSPASDPLMASFRMVLGGIYHKALCVIHSKFLKSAATDQQYLYSWLGCIDSAMTLLAIQAFQHENFLVDGQVTALIHYQTSLTIHDFFLAATILCTTLFLEQTGPATEFPLRATAAPSRDKILQVLEKSMDIFDDGRGESAEASRACELLGALLYELRHPSRSQHDDTHLARAGSSNVAAQPPMSASSASTSLTNAGDMSSYQNVTSIPQLIGDNQGMRDIAQPFGEWDSTIFGLDLGDPISFVQSLHSQDNPFF